MTDNASSLRSWIGFLAISGGTFMAVLDTQIVASSLPEIGASLGATIEEASWLQTAYLIAEVITMPLAGWLSRSLSFRYLYALACALFTLASLLCGIAWSIESMIAIRVLQGLFAGILPPLLYQGIYVIFPRERRAGATMFAVLIISLAPIIGPTVGGWITQAWSWRWLFLLNLLPGIVITLSVLGMVRGEPPEWGLLRRFDFPGVILTALFLGSLEYVIGEGPGDDWFDSRLIAFLAIVAAVSALLLAWRELACRHPVIDLRAFRDRNFTTASLLSFAVGMGLFGSGYLMTLFLSRVKGYNSMEIGRIMAVPGIAMMVSIPLVRQVRRRLGERAALAAGLAMFGSAVTMNGFMSAQTGFDDLFWPQFLRGLAIMLCLSPVTELALGRLPVEAVPNASALFSLTRFLGGGIGIAVINTLADGRGGLHFRRLAEALDPARFQVSDFLERLDLPFLARTADPEQARLGGTRLLALLVRRESLVMTYNEIWLLMGALFAVMLLLMPLVRNVDRRGV